MHSATRTHLASLRSRVHQAALAALILLAAIPCQAAPPDLTTGGVPGDTTTTNLGATGMRGWVYHVGPKSDESRQIQVTAVAAGSPADGILAANDVILGANGSGAAPVNFSSDARRGMADAINDAEARNPATLKLIRWRAGATTTVTLTLRTMGAYSTAAPYNCPKSTKILREGLSYVMGTNVLGLPVSQETTGRYSFGTLSLLAANNPSDPANAARMARAETEALALRPDAPTMAQMMSDVRDTASGWQRGHTLIVLAEYYLVTGDTRVLPAIEAYAVNIAKNQSLFGTLGHIYAEKNKDGSNNGPMGGQYGPVNSAGMPCFLGVLLARQCGLTNTGTIALLDASIERTSRFFAYYAGRGAVPYGEHEPGTGGHENNGKSGLAALCFGLQGSRVTEGQFFAKMATAATTEREIGHTGAWFNYIWAPLGAAAGGEETAASYFRRARWYFDLARRWDGGFDYDCLNEGPKNGAQYNDFRMSTAALLTYALPLRKLHLTGRGHNPARDLAAADAAAAEFADGYDATLRGTSDLVTDLGNWSPTVQRRAAVQLATRSIDSTLLAQITNLATNPGSQSRVGACYTLGKISNSTTANARAATLAGLLTDPDNKVRFIAAEAMRYLPDSAKLTQLNAILSAAASTGAPLLPFDEEDPLHFAHGRLAMLLFYSGNAYGPKGVIYGSKINTPTVINRNLLYPAIRAVAANPVGQARSTLDSTYQNLTSADVNALAGTLVESIHFRAPSDKMFSAGIRNGGLKALEKYNNADGVPLALAYMIDDGRTDAYTAGLATLQNYAGASTTVTPDPDVIGFCKELLSGTQAAAAQAVLNAIAADTNPTPLTPFKSIQSVTADASSLTLPANQTVLRASASDLAEGGLVYTWRKVHGAGNVSFTSNGTAAARDCTIVFNNIPGKYLFEVTVSDSRGFTEVYRTVPVTLNNVGGTLPTNNPPTATPQAVNATPSSVTPITLTGTDPEGYALLFTVTNPPVHGTLTGTAPNLNYTPDGGYTGSDSFTFQVMDSEGQVSSASVNLTVVAVSVEPDVYEPFDYPVGVLTGQNGGLGFSGGWLAPRGVNEQGGVWNETTNVFYDNITLDWDGVLNNGFPTSPASGARYAGATNAGSSNLNISRTLSTNAGALAGADGVLWMSAIYHLPNRGYGAGINIGLGNGYMYDRGKGFGTITTDFIGASGWNPVNTFNYKLNTVVVNDTWSTTTNDAWTASPSALPATTLDMIVVLKFTFGAASDTVEGYVFHEDVTTELTEATFESGKIATTSSIDESTLNVLSIAQGRFDNAIDEIRIGNSFASVIGVQGAPPDTTPPTLSAANIVDDRNGEPVIQNTPVSYSVTFSEEMNPATVDATDFSNAGSAAITVNSIIHPLPGVFVVNVTPTSPGSLRLQVDSGAVLTDLANNPLDTAASIADDTVITVNPLIVPVPNVTGVPQASAVSSITSVGLAVGAVTTQNSETVLAGDVIGQNPASGTSVAEGSVVDLMVSLGPVPDYGAWQAQYPGADLANRAADFDGDGVSNGEERLWGLDPTRASRVSPILEAPGLAGTFRYTRRDPSRTGATYSIWTSPSLLPDSWTEDPEASQVPGDPDVNHVETITATLSPGRLGGARLFVRVRVTE